MGRRYLFIFQVIIGKIQDISGIYTIYAQTIGFWWEEWLILSLEAPKKINASYIRMGSILATKSVPEKIETWETEDLPSGNSLLLNMTIEIVSFPI